MCAPVVFGWWVVRGARVPSCRTPSSLPPTQAGAGLVAPHTPLTASLCQVGIAGAPGACTSDTVVRGSAGVCSPAMARLVSFDVDGTLIRSVGDNANRLHREAFTEAFRSVFGIDTDIDVVHHHGSTDPLILIKVLEHHGIEKDVAMTTLPLLQTVMSEYFVAHAARAGEGLELLPGVASLLTELKVRWWWDGGGGVSSCRWVK